MAGTKVQKDHLTLNRKKDKNLKTEAQQKQHKQEHAWVRSFYKLAPREFFFRFSSFLLFSTLTE